MTKYKVQRTDTADDGLHQIILSIAENFGVNVALEKLEKIEKQILLVGDTPQKGASPRYMALRRQGYRVLICERDLIFYKIDEAEKTVIIYAIVDQRQDYLKIINGL